MTLTNRAAVAVAALALVAVGFVLRGLVDPSKPDAALAARVAALEQRASVAPAGPPQVARPAAGTTAARSAAAMRPSMPSGAAPGPADDGPGATAPSREEIARVQAMRRAELDARFAAEPLDAAWAKVAERELLDAAASDEATMIGDVPEAFESRCRSRTCRVRATFPPGGDADGWLSLYLLGAAGN